MEDNLVSSFYAEDHVELDGFLVNFRSLKKTNFPEAKENFKKFNFSLRRHIAWEEEILFPVFEGKAGMKDEGPTFVMRQEHRQIEQTLDALHAKVRVQDTESDLEEELLLNLLKSHNAKEEQILYPAIDQMTTPEEKKKLFQEMQDLPETKYKACCCHLNREGGKK